MKIVKDNIEITKLQEICKNGPFAEVVKAVIDIEKRIMAIDAEMHADLRDVLMQEEQSEDKNLWGVNLFPNATGDAFIVITSLINIKPGLGNKNMGIDNPDTKEKVITIINTLVKK